MVGCIAVISQVKYGFSLKTLASQKSVVLHWLNNDYGGFATLALATEQVMI
jgi:hypothetical protein